ncbi:copper resistance protein B [Stutzerimonas kirkiae]|uniref:Copper resistance protein CopB n=1 Tax=Stutzerimonas kirkiae TaxID=2211392 RepID=A0A4Q9R3D4_9GAMM|nr:copper resistance protein B [Stutzerimonas kirkiae]TBU93277.1 copper resistance protein CopB [Stutzerimonas kirkiae]TBV01411.1 copper resistance protein CopB [Stutzerimonas kirkiae]TBV06892.1 copper resistance protein CopB [Stutzerimonas kirkiae]TBV10393.1 copper resistance protein CopB [Stutzerimonas kirkiae]
MHRPTHSSLSGLPLLGLLLLGPLGSLPLAAAEDHATHADHGQHDHGRHATHDEHAPPSSPEQGQHGHSGHNAHGMHPPQPSTHDSHHHEEAPVPAVTDADRAAAFPQLREHSMHAGSLNSLLLVDQLEWQDGDAGSTLAWDIDGWLGGDIDRLRLRSEGERVTGKTDHAELQALWGHAIGPWWESVLGLRQDFKPGPAQTWAALGIQGTPLYGLEAEATAYLGEGGQSALRLGAEYDLLLSQRLVLQPSAEANLYGRTDESREIGAGFSDLQLGLRLRYEIRREFAPYIGVDWQRHYGNSADLRRANGEDSEETRLVLGVRFWF